MAPDCRTFRRAMSSHFVGPSDPLECLCVYNVGMIDLKAMGARIADLRRRAGIATQEGLAAELSAPEDSPGWGRSAIGGIESGGDRPGLLLAVAIADRFRVPMDWLLGRKVPTGGPLLGQFVDDPDELAWLNFWRELLPEERPTVLKMLRISQINKIDG